MKYHPCQNKQDCMFHCRLLVGCPYKRGTILLHQRPTEEYEYLHSTNSFIQSCLFWQGWYFMVYQLWMLNGSFQGFNL
jgi:hypothetical protein